VKPLHILIVEGNPRLRTLLGWQLQQAGHEVRDCSSARQARTHLESELTHLAIVDGDLPGNAGLELCRWAHRQMDLLILMLSEKDSEADAIAALQAGADDYLTKPMSMQLFVARVDALARRLGRTEPPSCLTYSALKIDLVQRQVTVAGRAIELTPQEFSLLFVLAQAAGKPLSRSELLQRAWPEAIDNPRTVDTHILSLRKKLEVNPQRPHLIQTIRNVGYRFYVDALEQPASLNATPPSASVTATRPSFPAARVTVPIAAAART
jgi:two-component system OmpR family response regulator